MSRFVEVENQPIFECRAMTMRTGRKRDVLIWLFEDDATLQAATTEIHEGDTSLMPSGFAYTMVHTAEEIEEDSRTTAGHIVLSLPHLHMRSLCHEIFHVVMHIFDMDVGAAKIMDLADQETAAYMVSDLTYEIFSQLKAKGYLEVSKL